MRDEEKTKHQLISELVELRELLNEIRKPVPGPMLNEVIERQTGTLKRLLLVSQEITATTDLKRLYRKVVGLAKELLDFDYSTLMILSEDRTRLVIEKSLGFPEPLNGAYYLVEGQGLSSHVFKQRRPGTVIDFATETRFEIPALVKERSITSAVCVPMMLEEQVFGVLIGHTHARREFTDEEVSLYQNIANQAAVAIQNSLHLVALRENEQYLKTIMNAVQTGILIIDAASHRVVEANPVAVNLIGVPKEEIIGKVCHEFTCPAHKGECPITDLGRSIDSSEGVLLRGDRGEIPLLKTVVPVVLNGRRLLVESFVDITERKKMEEAIKYQASHDLLTDLPNRMLFMESLNRSLHQAGRQGAVLAVMFLDLDGFKSINDSLGHALGDQLLKEVASRLKLCTRKSDMVARIGGDEFIMMLADINDLVDAGTVASKVLSFFREPFIVEGHVLRVTASVGLSLYPGDGEDAETLLKRADIAMYYAKERGRNNYQVYQSAMRINARR